VAEGAMGLDEGIELIGDFFYNNPRRLYGLDCR
jgi:hypothetical protein